jgi:hypothetical protein
MHSSNRSLEPSPADCYQPSSYDGVSDPALHQALTEAVLQATGERRRMVSVERRTSPYRSSHALEEISIRLDDGVRLELLRKGFDLPEPMAEDLEPPSPRPSFLQDPRREASVYQRLLAPAHVGVPSCYGSHNGTLPGRQWLLLERVRGRELPEVGELAVWLKAARWLADFHGRFRGLGATEADATRLMVHDAAFYRLWSRRAVQHASASGSGERLPVLERLATGHESIVERLLELPQTLVHAEFYPSNVLVEGYGVSARLRPVDWETAALGPGLEDLAALTSGRWEESDRALMEAAYYDGMTESDRASLAREAFQQGLECCRLQLALQWLGWSADWSPPPPQSHDWLEEAIGAANRLGL